MKKEIIKSPTLLQMTIGLVFSIITKSQPISLPTKIRKYKFLKEVKKENPFKNYGIGIYALGKRKVFIKTWKGNFKNINYYLLLNEYLTNKILHKKLINNRKRDENYSFKIPQVIDLIESKNSLSVVFEYVKGRTLTSFPFQKQVDVLAKVLEKLENLTTLLSEKEKKIFPKRTLLFYLISLPLFAFINLSSNRGDNKVIFKALLNFLMSLPTISGEKLKLAHRDLDLHNVIISGTDVFIIDCGRIVLTIPNYDITYLSLTDNAPSVVKLTSRRLGIKISKFLENYILIQHCKWNGATEKFENRYMKNLYSRYG